MTGKVTPLIEKPVPLSVPEFTFTAAVPVELRVSVLVETVFRLTSPNASVPELTDS